MLSTFALDTQVIKKGLCTGCGACQGMCPYWGSKDGRTICYFDCERHEGRCQAFCPSMPTDYEALRNKFFDKDAVLPEIGPFKALYVARATDASIREDGAQHGGTVTALLEFAMKNGFMDAAVLGGEDEKGNPAGVLATTSEEVRNASGSKFKIPPTLATLNKALAADEYKKIGVVATPCKAKAVYKMKSKPLPEKDNNADNIGLVIGLFCGWGLEWDGLTELSAKTAGGEKVCHSDILPSKYHSMEFTTQSGTKSVDLDEVLPLVREVCKSCDDMTCEFADLSVGGARTGDGWDVDKGWNQVIIRSEKGEELFKAALSAGVIEIRKTTEGALDKLKAASVNKKKKAGATQAHNLHMR